MITETRRAAAVALALPALLLAGAYASEFLGLVACEMCWWQRWAHFAALAAAVPAMLLQIPQVRDMARHDGVDAATRFWTGMAALAILASGIIGAFHAGVEYGWWQGHTACAAGAGSVDLGTLMRQPLVRCDQAQWTLLRVSLAGYNAIISTAGAAIILAMTRRASRRRTS